MKKLIITLTLTLAIALFWSPPVAEVALGETYETWAAVDCAEGLCGNPQAFLGCVQNAYVERNICCDEWPAYCYSGCELEYNRNVERCCIMWDCGRFC